MLRRKFIKLAGAFVGAAVAVPVLAKIPKEPVMTATEASILSQEDFYDWEDSYEDDIFSTSCYSSSGPSEATKNDPRYKLWCEHRERMERAMLFGDMATNKPLARNFV